MEFTISNDETLKAIENVRAEVAASTRAHREKINEALETLLNHVAGTEAKVPAVRDAILDAFRVHHNDTAKRLDLVDATLAIASSRVARVEQQLAAIEQGAEKSRAAAREVIAQLSAKIETMGKELSKIRQDAARKRRDIVRPLHLGKEAPPAVTTKARRRKRTGGA